MEVKKKVLLVGWNPDVVDYSKWPGLTPEKLRAGLNGDRDKLNSLNYEASLGLIDSADTASDTVKELLSKQSYHCVLIGAGVRTVDDYILLFETLINIVHQHAPTAKICFNTGPFDSVDAVQRWI
ncbi:MAG: hypothetical protein COC19_04625 [SAR86 cluster bacterium]|uniref:Uncharacterized protein n=1 Tax=SAR86 cluster bacterium TaxID=2030880 RepID=A0A2A4MNT6_9GAMM|nr:MAG: hypothetical protein COC19_04625 [SAR86 cluster bacterium]